MQTTTNYGYNLVESTDTCNVPVQISPNFTDIDTDLKAVSDAALTSAVDTFAANVHALVRDDADRNLLFFIAPADYVAGDTFTLDGVSMNVTDVGGNALESNAFRVNSAVIGLVYGSRLTLNVVNPVTLPTLDADNVTYDNAVSGLTANDVQAAIDELVTAVNAKADATNVYTKAEVDNLIGVNFSTAEHVIGKWIDGTTDVYEKTLTGVSLVRSTGGSRVMFESGALATDVDILIDAFGEVALTNSSNVTVKMSAICAQGSSALSVGYGSRFKIEPNSNEITYQFTTDASANNSTATCTVTLRYTKKI